MKYITICVVISLILGTANVAVSQKRSIYDKLGKLIKVNEGFYTDKYYEKGFLFSINMGVNSKGLIDTVLFSHYRNDELSQLIDFAKIREGLKKDRISFKSHKNETLVLLVMIVRGDNAMININNGNQLLQNWSDIITSARDVQDSKRKQVFLIPMQISAIGRNTEF